MKRLLFLIIPILLAWCSSIESQVSKQVQESNASVEKQAELIKVATAEKIKQENIAKAWAEYLKALEWNISESIPNEAETWISNDSKPIVEDICTPVYTACYDNWTVNIEDATDCRENFKEVKDCDGLFWDVVWCYEKTNWTLCLLNNDPDKLNELFKF